MKQRKEQIEKILKEITNLDKLKELFKENSKVIFGNQEDIDALENDFRKAIKLTAKKIFKDIEKLGVLTYLKGTNERIFKFNPSEPTWKKLQEEYYETK